MQLQFTIPYVNTHWTSSSGNVVVQEDQQQLYISMAVYGESIECYDQNTNNCDTKVDAYKIQDTSKYVTGEWKVIHKIRVYNERMVILHSQIGTSPCGSRLVQQVEMEARFSKI